MSTYIHGSQENVNQFDDCPQILQQFLDYLVAIENKSPRTVNGYYIDLRVFFRWIIFRDKKIKFEDFTDIKIADIDENDVLNILDIDIYTFLAFCANKLHNSPNTRCRKIASIESFYKYLYLIQKKIAVSPASEIKRPKKEIREARYLELDECKKLLKSVDTQFTVRDYCIIVWFLNSGMRLAELASIDLDNIRDDKLSVIGKGNKERIIQINEAMRKSLESYLPERLERIKKPDQVKALFISNRNGGQRLSMRQIQNIVKRVLAEAGLDARKYTAHKLRHTAATIMHKYGNVDIRTLQEFLGHKHLSTTEIYTHVTQEEVTEASRNNPLNKIAVEIQEDLE